MFKHAKVGLLIVALLTLAAGSWAAETGAAGGAAEDVAKLEGVLKDKGLDRDGAYFVLPGELNLRKQILDIRKAKVAMAKASSVVNRNEQVVDRIKVYIAGKQAELRKVDAQLAQGNLPVARNNQLVAQHNLLVDDIKQVTDHDLAKYNGEIDKANDVYDKARQDYIDKSLAALAEAQKVDTQYTTLGKDPDVVKALADLHAATQRKYAIGPTQSFKSAYNIITAMNKAIASEDIPLTIENNVATTEVTLNGKTRRKMIVDTGASAVCLPWEIAQAVGLTPDPGTTTRIRVRLADGKLVEAWMMKLDSVQVGAFKVEGVDCAVLPKDLVAAQPLLGGTFLSHFVVKLDVGKKQLNLIRVKGAAH